MLSAVERSRLRVSNGTDARTKALLGQFLTPATVAQFMAGLFDPSRSGPCRLLDAGAGIGSLTAAFLERWVTGDLDFDSVEVDAFEIDRSLHRHLRRTLGLYAGRADVSFHLRTEDFISAATESLLGEGLFGETLPRYTHAIMNPPYKKIRSDSDCRTALRRVGIEVVNLYAAFMALAIALLEEGGQLVAIVPRSFCNGPYYRPFREHLLAHAAILRMHLFASRDKAFRDDDVLQENIILHLVRGETQDEVAISTSTDDTFSDLSDRSYPFDRIVLPGDPERFIHVPTSASHNAIEESESIRYALRDLGVTVSTGPVVDFRLKEHLRAMPEPGTVPLLYPAHFATGGLSWPAPNSKKPNAIARNGDTEKWLYPNGCYCVVRRFSSKEEKRRIVANVALPDSFRDAEVLGFENHLNVFHEGGAGLPEALARGLAIFLNTEAFDESFRRFSGHTQVNATDLRSMVYPSRESLLSLGEWSMERGIGVGEAPESQVMERLA